VNVLNDASIRDQFRQAWLDSQPDTVDAHEEGGFILQQADGSLITERWPGGAKKQIYVPPHPGGMRGNLRIVATFHTHPNSGPNYQQEPSLTDIRGVQYDPDLSHAEYEGEYVISLALVYLIHRDGRVETVGDSKGLLNT
jgi:hypothetical protein